MPRGYRGRSLATCHPDQIVKSHGLCQKCYLRAYDKDRPWYKRNWRRAESRRKYDISEETYTKLFDAGCAICSHAFLSDGHEPVFDHNHQTGAFRGLLCQKCNRGIGLLKDSPAVLEAAAEYVRSCEIVCP